MKHYGNFKQHAKVVLIETLIYEWIGYYFIGANMLGSLKDLMMILILLILPCIKTQMAIF